MPTLRIATRGSALALVQTRLVTQALTEAHADLTIEEVIITTEGDRDRVTPLTVLGGRGVFVRSVEEALLDGRADVAMHSLKDVPTEPLPGLTLAAVLPRADVRDALVTREGAKLADLPAGARVGTSSRRRMALLRAARPDVVTTELRGNVDTRLRRVTEGAVDAAVLAAAGLERLNRLDSKVELLDPLEFVPAPGQGAIVVQCRADDTSTLALLRGIDDLDTHLATDAERGVLAALGSGCSLPVGAYARLEGGRLRLRGFIGDEKGSSHFEDAEGVSEDATALGLEVGRRLGERAGVSA
jgi:hydroxymethylbilane synthase